MDNLVLTRLALELGDELSGTVLEELRQETAERFRLTFASPSGALRLVVSLRPRAPWIGRPAFRWDGPAWAADPFTNETAKALVGRRVERVSKTPCDRAVYVEFGDGRGLVVELIPHGANMILLGAGAAVEAVLRHAKRGAERLEPGRPWTPRPLPAGKLDPFMASAHVIDEVLLSRGRQGASALDALRGELVGIGSMGAELVMTESGARNVSPGSVLRERLDDLLSGRTEVVIEGPDEPRRASENGTFTPETFRLLPWRPTGPRSGTGLFVAETSLTTAGLFHDSLERVDRVRDRIAALGTILRGELRRARDAEARVREGLRSFDDPQRYARMGEALLAGLAAARRSGDTVAVPDPYDGNGGELAIPAAAGKPLTQVADELFQRGRRARRGAVTAAARADSLAIRARKLEALIEAQERASGSEAAASLEAAMREERLAVGLTRPTRAARAAALTVSPRLEGVRILSSADGWTILVGRTGRDNDRLTFKIAAPEDFWLHASGSPGAHVIIRNPERKASVPAATLLAAARAAAWFSDLKSDGTVEVHWTRRKYVRRARGGVPGRVVLKRFETVLVHPEPPSEAD